MHEYNILHTSFVKTVWSSQTQASSHYESGNTPLGKHLGSPTTNQSLYLVSHFILSLNGATADQNSQFLRQ